MIIPHDAGTIHTGDPSRPNAIGITNGIFKLNEKEIYWDADGKDLAYKSLMADHGDIAPTLEDFKEVYMRQ